MNISSATSEFDSPERVHAYLSSIPAFATSGLAAARWGLSGIRQLCELMGNPHESLAVIHIAGTNGKGTVAHYLSEVFKQNGYRVGVYTSPHLQKVNERWKINDQEMNDHQLLQLFQRYGEGIQQIEPTFFELTTALALRYFADEQVDLAVMETGLGGRLDATNIVDPVISVITSIDLDHQAVLGDTIAEIAGEKAGIIKPERPVVAGDLPQDARQVIIETADRNSAELSFATQSKSDTDHVDEKINPCRAVARRVLEKLSEAYTIDIRLIEEQLNQAQGSLKGRFERLHPNNPWYFDGAHNPAAVALMKKKLESMGTVSYATAVLSVMKDKATKEFVSLFSDFRKIYYHPLQNNRAATFSEIAPQISKKVEIFPQEANSRDRLLKSLNSELVIFTGSFYFYPCVKDWMRSF